MAGSALGGDVDLSGLQKSHSSSTAIPHGQVQKEKERPMALDLHIYEYSSQLTNIKPNPLDPYSAKSRTYFSQRMINHTYIVITACKCKVHHKLHHHITSRSQVLQFLSLHLYNRLSTQSIAPQKQRTPGPWTPTPRTPSTKIATNPLQLRALYIQNKNPRCISDPEKRFSLTAPRRKLYTSTYCQEPDTTRTHINPPIPHPTTSDPTTRPTHRRGVEK